MPPQNPDAQTESARKWAVVRFVLGQVQMFGALGTLVLLLTSGTSPATICGVVITGVFSLVSIYLFRIKKKHATPEQKA